MRKDETCSVWPLDQYCEPFEKFVGFHAPISSILSNEAIQAISEVSSTGRVVLIAWEAPDFFVVERIEPITDVEWQKDLLKAGVDWHSCYCQDFEVVVSYQFADPDGDIVREWLDTLSDTATVVAVNDFSKNPDLPLFVNDDSRSTLPSAVVLFSVGGIDATALVKNREAVINWSKQEFSALLTSTPLCLPTTKH